ncbi:MAG: metal ABC transporter substrate-binding protein [Erysipelotrichaceae bacterium]
MSKKLAIVVLLMLFPLTACSPKQIKVCSTVYPIHYLINTIGGDLVETCTIGDNQVVQRSNIASDFKEQLEDADTLFYVGGLEPYYELYIDDIRNTGVSLVDLSTQSAIYKFERYISIVIDNNTVGVEKPYYESSVFDEVNTYVNDPMIWMDPIAMTSMARTITDHLSGLLPEKARIFEANFAQLEVELARLDAEFQVLRTSNAQISMVTMTPSFGNWQKSYGINVYPVIMSKYGVLPNEAQLAAIKERIVADNVRYIAYENNMSEDMIALYKELASELGLITVRLHNLSSITGEDIKDNKNYQTIMYDNLEALELIAK